MHTHTSRKKQVFKNTSALPWEMRIQRQFTSCMYMHMVISNHLINECFTIQIRILPIRFLSLRQVFGI